MRQHLSLERPIQRHAAMHAVLQKEFAVAFQIRSRDLNIGI